MPHISVYPGSEIRLCPEVVLTGKWRFNDLDAPNPCVLRTLAGDAVIRIGEHSGMTSAAISAAKNITIGKRVLIGSGVIITDTDHHPVVLDDVSQRRHAGRPPAKARDEIQIADDVFIGARSIVLKGSKIGKGTVVGAGSVVSGILEPYSVYAGNPAVLIKRFGEV